MCTLEGSLLQEPFFINTKSSHERSRWRVRFSPENCRFTVDRVLQGPRPMTLLRHTCIMYRNRTSMSSGDLKYYPISSTMPWKKAFRYMVIWFTMVIACTLSYRLSQEVSGQEGP